MAGTPVVADNPDAFEIDGAWFCNQLFALCTTAPCKASESDPSIAVCPCVVEHGLSMGFTSCGDRTPSGTTLTSTFSTINVNPQFGHLSCPESSAWADCLDMPCEIDALDPALATCQCELKSSGPSLTFGGSCDAETCNNVIWSGTTPGSPGVTQYETAMQRVGQTVNLPPMCPANASASTPVSA